MTNTGSILIVCVLLLTISVISFSILLYRLKKSTEKEEELLKENPKTKLWSPKLAGESFAITSATKVMATNEVEKLLQLHLATWGEKNVEKRTKNFKLIYTEDVNIVDPFFILNGTANLNPFIDDLQKKHPGFKFSLAKPIETHNNIARLFWQFGPESKPDTITGQDVFAIENNKIKSLYIFIDGLKK